MVLIFLLTLIPFYKFIPCSSYGTKHYRFAIYIYNIGLIWNKNALKYLIL